MSASTDYYAESFLPRPAGSPCVLVLFGGAGALARRKLAPALYNLAEDRLLPTHFALLGAARTPRTDDDYRRLVREAIERHSRRPTRAEVLDRLLGRTYYQSVRPERPADWDELGRRLRHIDDRHGTAGARLVYLSTPPDAYPSLIAALGRQATGGANARSCRIVIEKPLGTDLDSAAELSQLLHRWFDESAIYRIDHFLGKETVQNLLVFRFANAIFEPLMHRNWVHDVQITVAEDAGIGDRAGYYESAGALRDMVQNHLLQLLCLTAMEPPLALGGEAIRDEKVKVLRAIGALTPGQVARQTARGRYAAAAGHAGYRDERGVAPDSQVETYAAVRLEVRNQRWAGVPFYLRTGKRLARRAGEIVVTFKREAVPLFGFEDCDWRLPNRLIFRLQPAEGICIAFDAKAPGPRLLLRPVRMDFDYGTSFEMPSPEAYERLLLDALKGESSLFARADEVEASWRIVDSIRAAWDSAGRPALLEYPCGTWGPDRAANVFADDETSWQTA